MDSHDSDDIREMAEWLHEVYEHEAEMAGWNTQDGTSTAFDDLPEANKKVMLGLASKLLHEYDVERE